MSGDDELRQSYQRMKMLNVEPPTVHAMTKPHSTVERWAGTERANAKTEPDKAITEIIIGSVEALFGSGPGEFYTAKPVEPGRVTIEEWEELTAPKEPT